MKSDIYNQDNKIDFILSETERVGEFSKLTPPEVMKLRLLAEEILNLTVRMFDNLKYDFFIENEERCFKINLRATTHVNMNQKDRVLSLSSQGKNKATKGILGKISGLFEDMIMDSNTSSLYTMASPLYHGKENTDIYFSLSYYQNQIPETEKETEWDGLEKSIIAHISDDVTIGVKSDKVEVIATITF